VRDFVRVWTKVMNADRFDLADQGKGAQAAAQEPAPAK